MARHRRLKELGVPFLDITAMSGLQHFAPEMRYVRMYKSGTMLEDEYTRIYIDKMRRSVRDHAKAWEDLAQYEKVAVACYCRVGVFCHRHIWVTLVKKYFARKGIAVIDMGEFTCDDDLKKEVPEVVNE